MREGWQIKKLGDLFDITSSKRVFKSEWKNSGVPFYRAREIVRLAKNGAVDNDLFISDEMYNDYAKRYGIPKEGDLMVTGVGTLGVCYLVRRDDKFYFKDGNIIWLKKKSDIDSRFVQYAFESPFLKEYIGNSAGATVGTYTITKAKETPIPVPSFPEQKRIVAILDEAFAGLETAVANTEKNLANARELFEGHLNSVFTFRSDAWYSQKLSDLSNIGYGYTASAKSDRSGIKFLRITDIQNGRVNWKNVPTCDIDQIKFEKYKLTQGDIVFARTGATTGKSYFVNAPPESVFASYLIRVQLTCETILPEFVYMFFQSDVYWENIKSGLAGSAQGGFNASKLGQLEIPFPKDIDEQRTLVAKLNDLDSEVAHLESIYQQKLTALAELKQSLLQKAFSGELTANLDNTIKGVAA